MAWLLRNRGREQGTILDCLTTDVYLITLTVFPAANVIVESRKYIPITLPAAAEKLILLNKCDRQMPCSHVCGIFRYVGWY